MTTLLRSTMPDFKIDKNISKPGACKSLVSSLPYSGLVGSNPTSNAVKRVRPKLDSSFPCAAACTHYLDCWLEKGLALPDWITIRDVPQEVIDTNLVPE